MLPVECCWCAKVNDLERLQCFWHTCQTVSKRSSCCRYRTRWTTLFFFFGLFITVEAVVQVGIIETMADAALRLTGGDLALTSPLLLWLSAVARGTVDNIPYTAAMVPIVEGLGEVMQIEPLWWSLTLGPAWAAT